MRRAPYAIIEILWQDSESHQEWKELKEVAVPDSSLECITVGYLLLETDDRLIIASSLGLSSDQNVSGHVTIPKVAVLARRSLSSKRKTKKTIIKEESGEDKQDATD